ncbi:hypothetical protein ACFPMF_23250 [Larkinella bovis]|uniref:Secretion system C-terminal sorting domain-containing protein n=1 Tax=Larkinella bovis TaxID=683041 RepID=A0ABW0IIG6_9BACT
MKMKIYKLMNRQTGLLMLVLMVLFVITSVRAQTPKVEPETENSAPTLQLSFHEIGNLKFRLEVTRPLTLLHDNVDIFILSDDKQILFANKYSHHALRITTFDLSTLEDGTYRFRVRSGGQRIEQLFDIRTKTTRIIMDQE